MKLTYLTWGYLYDQSIIKSFQNIGFLVETVALPCTIKESDNQEAVEEFKKKLIHVAGDMVFSVNFFAYVSDICMEQVIPYCSWVLQLPNYDLYQSAVLNACNYLGICDSFLTKKMWELGVTRAFFLPDAIDLEGALPKATFEREACFVARCPETPMITEGMSLYSTGYLEAFLHAQRVLYGTYILDEGLINRVLQEVMAVNPVPEDVLPQMQKLFMADKYFAPACTSLQQNIFLQNFQSIMTIYSDGEFTNCNCEKHSYVEAESARRKIYAGKEFTVILAPHVLHNGIPRDFFEVIAAGGFPLAGYQQDYDYFFENGKNIAYFNSSDEFKQLLVKYGNNHELREKLREAAYEAVAAGHTYQHRISTMLDMWERM